MKQIKSAMSFAELLNGTNSDGVANRIEARVLPKDLALQDRYALIFAGPHARDLLQLMVDALNRHFTQVVEEQNAPIDVNGSSASA